MDLSAIFGSAHHLTGAQEAARAAVIFAYGLVVVRIAGRRVFGKWSALDMIVSVVAGSSLSRAMTGGAPFGGTLVATTVLFALHWVFAQAAARSRRVSVAIEGAAVDLAQGGRLADGVRRRHGVSSADLDEAIRRHGLADLAATRRVTLEPSGSITVLKREDG